MIELEDIVPRRDYRLKIDWNCKSCPSEYQGKRVQIYGITLPGEWGNDKEEISWDDLFHIKCIKNHITRPERFCTKCGNRVPFESSKCPPCESRVIKILQLEESLEIIKEQTRAVKRQKKDTSDLLQHQENIKEQLVSLGTHPCEECKQIWINQDINRCKECGQ